MLESHVIFNLNRMPFLDFDLAARMRDLLMKESGHFYRVEQYQADKKGSAGFVVVRNNADHATIQQTKANIKRSVEITETSLANSRDTDHQYRPALRSYFLYFPLFFASVLLFTFSLSIWSFLLSLVGVNPSSDIVDINLLIQITEALAVAIFLINLMRLLYRYYSIVLIIDGEGVTLRKGIVARDFMSIRFSEIKTIGVKQGILARLLNIGNLEFASSGSDGVDITFTNIVNPGATKNAINSRVTSSK
ncbi:MAG: PH domain-containing protein [Gammaproteobacteria bacterium]|nr:PH domain-containing protein [Gammaproteobacteria bacterium]